MEVRKEGKEERESREVWREGRKWRNEVGKEVWREGRNVGGKDTGERQGWK